MKETTEIVQAWRDAQAAGTDALLATVVGVHGSAYRRPGARMLLVGQQWAAGSISGGCLEDDVRQKAWWRTQNGSPALVTYDTTDDEEAAWGLGCHGVVRVLLERLTAGSASSPVDFIARCTETYQPGVLATVIAAPQNIGLLLGQRLALTESTLVYSNLGDNAFAQFLTQDAHAVLKLGQSETRAYPDGTEVFYDVIQPPTPLVVFGAGHDAAPLVRLAAEIGWQVMVVDTHSPVARPAHFPDAEVVACAPVDIHSHVTFNSRTVVVVMTHSYAQDRVLLPLLFESSAAYIGLLGPQARAQRLLSDIEAVRGVLPAKQRARLHAPVGLDIGASEPTAIALSILSEAQAVLAGRCGGFLRERASPIYDSARQD